MSEIVLKIAFVSLDGNDLSSYVKAVTLTPSAEMLDKTAMGDDTRNKMAGMKDLGLSIELHQDLQGLGLV